MKKNPALQDSPPAAGRVGGQLLSSSAALLAERFYRIETKFLYDKKGDAKLHLLFKRSICCKC